MDRMRAKIYCLMLDDFLSARPTLIDLLQRVMILPSNSAICKYGFSKQSWVEPNWKTILNLRNYVKRISKL